MNLLELRNLGVRYRLGQSWIERLASSRPSVLDAVLDISLTLEVGKTLAIVGESGSGKSSLANAIAGLTQVASGEVLFEGRTVIRPGLVPGRDYHRQLAMMFQDPVGSLSPRRTVRQLLEEPFIIHRQSSGDLERETRHLLDLVGLPASFAERYPHQLSGGQARRVGVARAIALRPKVIIADEPTAGLDVSIQGDVINLLGQLQREFGLSYVIITHNLAIIPHVSDHVAVMYMGRLVEEGPTDRVMASPAHPYTAALLASQPDPDPRIRSSGPALKGEVSGLLERPDGCAFHPRCERASDICRTQAPVGTVFPSGRLVSCHYPILDSKNEGDLTP